MIKGIIIAVFLVFVMGCSNQPTQPQTEIKLDHDGTIIGTWISQNPPDTITFDSNGRYKERVLIGIGVTIRIEAGNWYTSYGTIYINTTLGMEYKIEYKYDNQNAALSLCKYILSSTATLTCHEFIKL